MRSRRPAGTSASKLIDCMLIAGRDLPTKPTWLRGPAMELFITCSRFGWYGDGLYPKMDAGRAQPPETQGEHFGQAPCTNAFDSGSLQAATKSKRQRSF